MSTITHVIAAAIGGVVGFVAMTLLIAGDGRRRGLDGTLGRHGTGGMLTAEQVREAVMSADRWEKPMGNTGLTNTHLIIRDDGWQAIADELNAALGLTEGESE